MMPDREKTLPGSMMEEKMKRFILSFLSVMLCVSLFAPMGVMAADNDVVYVTNTGSKYHAAGCRSLRKSKRAITLAQAKQAGYTPCSVCLGGSAGQSDTSSVVAISAPAASAPAAVVPAETGVTAEQAVQKAYALYVQSGLDSNTAMTRVQAVLSQISANPGAYAQIVQQDLAAMQGTSGSAKSAEQLVQEMYAALVAQGMNSEQALQTVQANLPALLAQAK